MTLGLEYGRVRLVPSNPQWVSVESRPLVRTHHVHIVELGGSQWEAYLLFREHLMESKEAREV
jgi:GrpB-like predicted nucleotidyltransferase (UPF0157 family)